MDSRKVTLVIENPNDPQLVELLRYWYGTMLKKLVTELVPRWEEDAKTSMQGIGPDAIGASLSDMVSRMHYKTRIFARPDDDIVCDARFGYYCTQRDAVILWFPDTRKHDEFFRKLFGLEQQEPVATEQFYLVFSFDDIRIASVVSSKGRWLEPLDEMPSAQREEIFKAAGYKKPEGLSEYEYR